MIDSYYDGSDILTEANKSPDYTRISPSGVSRFFSHPRQWWGETMLNEPGFEGNTGTILGTICHHFAELGSIPPNHHQEVTAYLATQTIDFDRDIVLDNYYGMSEMLLQDLVVPSLSRIHSKEQFIHHELLPGIYIAGTYDVLLKNPDGTYTVRDYKSAAKKPSSFSYDYRMQAYSYAYALEQSQNITISHVELAYVVQPTKTMGPRTFTFIEPFTNENRDAISGQLNTIAESIHLWNTQSDMRWALAQDLRLREAPPPVLFQD